MLVFVAFSVVALTLPTVTQQKHFHRRPRITEPLKNVTVRAGERAVLRCTAVGRPQPNMVINRKGGGISGLKFPGRDHVDIKASTSIEKVFETARLSHSGWYKCFALNQRNLDTSLAYLNVVSDCANCKAPEVCTDGICSCDRACLPTISPVCASDCRTYFEECQMNVAACKQGLVLEVISRSFCPRVEYPMVVAEQTDVRLAPGGKVVLTVIVHGKPTPKVSWYKKTSAENVFVGEGPEMEVREEGKYFAEAVNCVRNSARSKDFAVEEEEVTEEAVALFTVPENQKTCTIIGGSNVVTFDKWMYSFDGGCSFVLAMDCAYASWFVYVRYLPCKTGRCLVSATIISGHSQVQLLRGWIINDNGKQFEFTRDIPFEVQGISGHFDGLELTMVIQELVLVKFDGYSVVQVLVPEDAHTCGLCGNNDGEQLNDVEKGRRGHQESLNVANFVQSWKLPISRTCGEVQAKELGPSTVAGGCLTDPTRKDEYKLCRNLFDVDYMAGKCIGVVMLRFLYDRCRYDACFGEYPLDGNTKLCYTAQAISNIRCSQTEIQINSKWEDILKCNDHETRLNAIVNVGW